ncbi:MAG: holdfast anchoring protein HfaA [Alphaproteobacteria bacterium]|nr:holdfast anchoring protein HfaA [Alphaproteobacteria bacterium]
MTTHFAIPALIALSFAACGAAAQAQSTSANWERPYGYTQGQEQRAWSGVTASAGAAGRSSNGTRVVIDGLIQTGVGVSSQVNGYGNGGVGSSASAIGNQLNVNVQGNWNTVIVNSTQVNSGDVNAYANANGDVSEDNDED